MKKILFLALLVLSIVSCQNNKKEKKETIAVKPSKTIKIDDTEKIEKLTKEFESLYNELLSFKNKADFREFGFGTGGPYNKWLKNVENLKNNPDSKLLLKKGLLFGDLEQLGIAYVNSKGKETDFTKEFNKIFTEVISSKPVVKVETPSGNNNYEKIKSEYELFGMWQISITVANELYSYPYEIYKKNNKYIGVITEGEFKSVILDKKGDKYYQKGNEYGEYYRIDGNKNMTLFDKDGELSSMGWKATKK